MKKLYNIGELISSEKLAGCFKQYASKKKISLKKAIEKASEKTAHEIAQKNH